MDVLEFWAAAYYRLGAALQQWIIDLDNLVRREGSEAPLPPEWRVRILQDTEQYGPWVWALSRLCGERLGFFELEIKSEIPMTARIVHGNLLTFSQFLIGALNEVLFLYVPEGRARLHMSPLDPWGDGMQAAFPSTISDAKSASECLALGQWTACVFHCMRVLKGGFMRLRADFAFQSARPLHMSNGRPSRSK